MFLNIDFPAGDGKMANFFLQCSMRRYYCREGLVMESFKWFGGGGGLVWEGRKGLGEETGTRRL